MPWTCVVPRCTTGYGHQSLGISMFKVPSDPEQRGASQRAIPRENFVMKDSHRVCANHFLDSEIVTKVIHKDKDGNVIAEARLARPRLSEGAVPSQFPGCPSYLSRKPSIKRREIIKKSVEPYSRRKLFHADTDENASNTPSSPGLEIPDEEASISAEMELFFLLANGEVSVKLPDTWGVLKIDHKNIVFFQMKCKEEKSEVIPLLFKQVVVQRSGRITGVVLGNSLSPFGFHGVMTCVKDVQNAIDYLSVAKICEGSVFASSYPNIDVEKVSVDQLGRMRHTKCTIVIQSGLQCQYCAGVVKLIQQKLRRMARYGKVRVRVKVSPKKREKLCLLRRRLRAVSRSKLHLQARCIKMKADLHHKEQEMERLDVNDVEQKLAQYNMTKCQRDVVQEILAASKCRSSQGRRYSEDWLLMCLLLHIRSPSGYNFLRDHDILPLPSSRTVRNYLSVIDSKCGFDDNFLKVLQLRLQEMASFGKHGILSLDEIHLRESVSVCSTTLTYKGLIDFGDDGPKALDFDAKANNALVLMFQPLGGNFQQPIATFAGRGPTHGTVLAKIILKAILLLERAGVKIHGIVSDNAATNQKMWTELGVCGKRDAFKNYFEHPSEEGRKVFVFSDTPHLIKNVRNRLYNSKDLKIPGYEVAACWSHIRNLLVVDQQNAAEMRLCPRLTKNHAVLSNPAKMRVRLAAQVLSGSVGNALLFYKKRNVGGLKDCDATAEFCLKFNAIFDALNRKTKKEGLRPGCDDLKLIGSSLQWLDEWNDLLRAGKITKAEFLSHQTYEGLRLTFQSTIDICEYLFQFWDFKYVLSGNINQDPLERFFGIIRQACGSNDHPAVPNFLQLYKLLCTYSIIKPPKSGNCLVFDGGPPQHIVTISSLKEIYAEGSDKSSRLSALKRKLDMLVEYDDWEFDDMVEHDYSQAPVVDCLIYYLTGYLARQVIRWTKCSKCKAAVAMSQIYSQNPAAELVNMKTKGGLLHPNRNLFLLLCELENRFQEHCKAVNVYECVTNSILETYRFTFPCFLHGEEVLAFIINYYLRMRMRQFSSQINRGGPKENREKKKVAKFSIT